MARTTFKQKLFNFQKLFLPKYFNKSEPIKSKMAVAMLHSGRCGSTVLAQMLGQHPEICWAAEIFTGLSKNNIERVQSDEVLPREVYSLERNNNKRVFGFETKFHAYQQLNASHINIKLEDYLQKLNENNFSKFILLERKNALKRIVSRMVGEKTGIWHKRTKDHKKSKLTTVLIDVHHFKSWSYHGTLKGFLRYYESENSLGKELLKGKDHLFLSYEEDILKNPKIAYQKVAEFLQLSTFHPKIILRKSNTYALAEIIENYDEVDEHLRSTPYYWMLSD